MPRWADSCGRNWITSWDVCEAFLRLLSVVACLPELTMPPHALNELTPDEEELLVYASKMLTALRMYTAALPQTPKLREYWTSCLGQDLVCTFLPCAYPSL